jgi:signal transduction histidine kinase
MTKRMIKPRLIEIGDINPSRFKRISEIYKEKGLVPLDANLKGFHYLDYMAKSNNLMTLVIAVSSILALLTIVLMFVILINNRLKQAVKARTENLAEANLRLKKLIGFVAHDLRNPLGAILSFSKLAQSPRYKERMPQILENIGASAAKGLELVKSALETTALGTGKFELEIAAFDLREAIELSVESFMTIANGKDVSFNVEVPENTIVDADKNRIIQVLDNIILNAIKYSSDSSVIHIQAIASDKAVKVSCTNDVPQGYQVEAEEEGLYRSFGFGIEIIREILELHRSKLELYSNDSEFVVKFTLEKE